MVVDWGQLCASVDWLDPISKKCRENMGAIRRDCEAAMHAVENDCRFLVRKAVSGIRVCVCASLSYVNQLLGFVLRVKTPS